MSDWEVGTFTRVLLLRYFTPGNDSGPVVSRTRVDPVRIDVSSDQPSDLKCSTAITSPA